jgi:hypothetical protein
MIILTKQEWRVAFTAVNNFYATNFNTLTDDEAVALAKAMVYMDDMAKPEPKPDTEE